MTAASRVATARSAAGCSHELGGLPCVNPAPHPGQGRGCVHHSTSGVPARHDAEARRRGILEQ